MPFPLSSPISNLREKKLPCVGERQKWFLTRANARLLHSRKSNPGRRCEVRTRLSLPDNRLTLPQSGGKPKNGNRIITIAITWGESFLRYPQLWKTSMGGRGGGAGGDTLTPEGRSWREKLRWSRFSSQLEAWKSGKSSKQGEEGFILSVTISLSHWEAWEKTMEIKMVLAGPADDSCLVCKCLRLLHKMQGELNLLLRWSR